LISRFESGAGRASNSECRRMSSTQDFTKMEAERQRMVHKMHKKRQSDAIPLIDIEEFKASSSRRWPFVLTLLLLVSALLAASFWWFHGMRSPDKPIPKERVAFVVLTDPRENHEENVIPMLKHVEEKYGKSFFSDLLKLNADLLFLPRLDRSPLLHHD